MNDPFFKPLGEMVPKLGRVSKGAAGKANGSNGSNGSGNGAQGGSGSDFEAAPEPPVEGEKAKPKAAKLSNPKWEAEKVGFNEETPVSVQLDLPPDIAHKTKVSFELFAKTPKGPEKISQGEAFAKDGKATCAISVYIPAYQDENGDRLRKVEYYFNAKHSEAEPLDGSKAAKLVEEMADLVLEMHVLQNVTFATGKSFIRTSEAGDLKALGQAVKAWKGKHAEGKLAVFGHADAGGEELSNKTLSERRAKSVHAYLAKDPDPWEQLYGEEKWGLASVQELLKHLGHDPGVIDGQDGPKTQSAVKEFQGKAGLGQTGIADAKTRAAIFLAFFGSTESPGSAAKDFDVIDGKAFTGCSEFNLIENTQGAIEANRRVSVLLLKTGKNFPVNYPCKQGAILPCQKQAGLKGSRRTAGFRCKFYDNLVAERKGSGGGGTVTPVLQGKFLAESAYCGDTVQLELSGSGIPPKTPAKIEIKSTFDNSVLDTVEKPVEALPQKADWIAKRGKLGWDTPAKFTATAAKAKAESGNTFKFKRMADAAKVTKTIPCTSGVFGWTGKFDIEFKNGTLEVTTKVKLVNRLGAKPDPGGAMPAAGAAVSDVDKSAMKSDIESKLSGAWILHRKKCGRGNACDCAKDNACCKFKVKVIVDFVESGEHHVVNLFQGPGRANASNWTRVKTRDNSWAHETGHLLAWFDEYVGGAVGTAPRWKAPNTTAVMSSGLDVPFEYYWDFRDWLQEKTTEEWDGVK